MSIGPAAVGFICSHMTLFEKKHEVYLHIQYIFL